ncbi:hypothetical protein CONCODRAFT_13179 [Conidiobolus coronatus NRRL 28638]|uniref:F-box domain-containing protein n=1 Tax=Conidiobolus coronatus (strain ATCC 28846 / CBS 209.66 / NRRL 28638) TaxID=796925 RepID=A0A137NRB3_CONC2|nr:hypothetical protein CONCODRAFT_13179 [Conidiobolus coronatus NRRL 28638]|eukprot:KXN65281.1 hypothetical protein CONCODRAFT_13179 [Conidiobolus coronatus NRRL 28638]
MLNLSKIDWVNFFTFNEVNQYCGCDDLVQLSMVCKVVRVSLRNTILNTFNFTSFTNSKEYKSCIIDSCQDILENDVFWIINPYKPMTSDLIESKKRFKSDLSMKFQMYSKISNL